MRSHAPLTAEQRSQRARIAAGTRHGNAEDVDNVRKEFERSRLESDVLELLKRTRTERGMALVIDDPAVIAQVARIVAAGGDAA